jgi:hypothetical protein
MIFQTLDPIWLYILCCTAKGYKCLEVCTDETSRVRAKKAVIKYLPKECLQTPNVEKIGLQNVPEDIKKRFQEKLDLIAKK